MRIFVFEFGSLSQFDKRAAFYLFINFSFCCFQNKMFYSSVCHGTSYKWDRDTQFVDLNFIYLFFNQRLNFQAEIPKRLYCKL